MWRPGRGREKQLTSMQAGASTSIEGDATSERTSRPNTSCCSVACSVSMDLALRQARRVVAKTEAPVEERGGSDLAHRGWGRSRDKLPITGGFDMPGAE